MQSDYPLVQTDANFDEMNWHDCPIYAMFIDYRSADFVIDADYIYEWLRPSQQGKPFSYLIAPVTLVFHSAVKVQVDLESSFMPLRIAEVTREDRSFIGNTSLQDYRWIVQGHHGSIHLRAVSYTQYRRQQVIQTEHQGLSLEQRHDISFFRGFGLTDL